jgi:hypothetical protein
MNMSDDLDVGFEQGSGSASKFAEPARANLVENFYANHGCHSIINMHSTLSKQQQNRVKRAKGVGMGS